MSTTPGHSVRNGPTLSSTTKLPSSAQFNAVSVESAKPSHILAPPPIFFHGIQSLVVFRSILLGLFGVTIVQTYTYFNTFRDTQMLKLFFSSYIRYTTIWESTAYTAISHTSKCMVQVFFATRIYLVRKHSWVIPGIVHSGWIVVGTAAGFAVISDVTATAAMCHFLAEIPSEMKSMKTLRNSLLIFVINRGALVTLLELIFGVSILVAPVRAWWIPFYLTKNKVYINTTRLTRGTLRAKATAHTLGTIRFTDPKKSGITTGERTQLRQSFQASILDPPSAVYVRGAADTQQFRSSSPTLALHAHTNSVHTSGSDPDRIQAASEC
ncbi:hypothetical protein BD410DRAFT_798595 [Rickenella mellea]|uniref:DUF6534 domain-containing protein n=1 Tax=Rickenella mellea TaxID=50990 RepID=A0A4R5XGE5_9AGAM|nr:hypothetical protein BD410DRAFT_798595 [Rickenella mellea]